MTTTLIPADLVPVLRAYRTAEFATIGRSGVPIAWPTSILTPDDGASLVLGTSIGFPQKAHNVRRDPRVALLFSDPTGSGAPDRPHVLVQGTATCTDDIVTSVVGNEAYWSRLWELQPHGLSLLAPATRWAVDWYFMRLMITVTPTRVRTSPPLPASAPPTVPPPPPGAPDAYARLVAGLPRYTSAVLTTLDEDGTPTLRRVRPVVDPGERVLVVGDGDGHEPLRPGPASLLCHSHDEVLWQLTSMVGVGRLEQRAGAWVFVPTRFVPGAGTSPVAMVRMIRTNRRTARQYLRRRGTARPRVPWSEYTALAHGRPREPVRR